MDLHDPASVFVDESGRSVGFFCQNKPVKVDIGLIESLKTASENINHQNVRLCLHENPDSLFHEMIILERRGKYYRPHKHISKGESYHIIEGSLAVFIFEHDGTLIDTSVLEPHGNLIYRIGPDMYHAILPLSDVIIYHESKPGPFLREQDSIFPDWAPDGSNSNATAQYLAELSRQSDISNFNPSDS